MHVYGPHVWHLQNTSPHWPMAGPQLRGSSTLSLKAPGPNQGGKDPKYWLGKWRDKGPMWLLQMKLHQALMTASLKGIWGLRMSDLISQSSISCVHAKLLQLCPTLCNPMDCNPPGLLSMGFSRQEYWSGLPFPFPGDLPDPGIQPAFSVSPALQMDSLPLSYQGSPPNHSKIHN